MERRRSNLLTRFVGLHTRDSAFEIPQAASPDLNNIEFYNEGWSVRGGFSRLNGSELGAEITSIFDGFNDILVTSSTKSYTFNQGTGAFTEKGTSLTDGAQPMWASYNGLDIMVNGSGNDAPQKWDGSTWAALGGSPPKADCIEVWRNRVWLAGLASPNQAEVQYSELEDPETWPGGFLRVGKRSKGLSIVGLKAVPVPGVGDDGRLAAFCEDSIYHFEGFGGSSWQIYPANLKIGCISKRSIVVAEGFTYWIDRNGIYQSPDGGRTVVNISWMIQPTFKSLSAANLSKSIGIHYRDKRQVLFFVPGSGSTLDTVLVYNYGVDSQDLEAHGPAGGSTAPHVWTKYTLSVEAAGEVVSSGEYKVYIGEDTNGYLCEFDNGTTDGGTAIDWHWKSKQFRLGEGWRSHEVLRVMTIIYESTDVDGVDVKMFADGADQPTVLTELKNLVIGALWDVGAWDEAVWGDTDVGEVPIWYNHVLSSVQFQIEGSGVDLTCRELEIETRPKPGRR